MVLDPLLPQTMNFQILLDPEDCLQKQGAKAKKKKGDDFEWIRTTSSINVILLGSARNRT
jgi:hypothetical protein